MSLRDGTSHPQTGRLASYRLSVHLRRLYAKTQTSEPKVRSPLYMEKRLKNIVVTREVDTRSEQSPELPTRKFLGDVRLNRSSPRRRARTMDIPSPLPSSPTATTADGSRFFEDPGWGEIIHRANVPATTSVGVFENDIGAKARVPPYEAKSTQLFSISDSVEPTVTVANLGGDIPATPRELFRESSDSTREDQKCLSCAPLQFQSTGLGRTASLLKGVAQKVWLGKHMKAQLRTSESVELAQRQGPDRIAIPGPITIGRRLRSQKKSENLRVSSGMHENSTATHTTLRLVNPDVEEPRPDNIAQLPELAFLHNFGEIKRLSNGLSESMKLLQDQMGLDGQLPDNTRFSSDEPGAPRPILSTETSRNDGDKMIKNTETGDQRYVATKSHTYTPYAASTKDNNALPIVNMTKSMVEDRKLKPPTPGPRTSSKGGIFANFIKTGKPPLPAASPLVSRGHASNTSKQRKGSESSFTEYCCKNMNPAVSTDTLAKIEVEAQVSPGRPTYINVPIRFPTTPSIDSGPSGSPPERALPQLPEDDSVDGSRSRSSSRKRHSLKQSENSVARARDRPSISSLSTVRGVSPAAIGSPARMSQDQVWKSHLAKPQSVAYRQSSDGVSVGQSTTSYAGDLRSHASIYIQDASVGAAASAFMDKQAQKAARADRVKVLKQRDLRSQALIEEEDERDTASPVKQTLDPFDQFPNVPSSRPASCSSTRRARSTQRAQSAAHRIPRRGVANQVLARSEIKVVADARPSTPKLKISRTLSTKSRAPGSPLRDNSIASLRHKSKHHLLKKASQRSIQSHVSASALPLIGAHTPPSSSDSSEAGNELPIAEMQRLEMLSMVETINAGMIMQGREIVKMQRMLASIMPTASRSRSRDLFQEHQFASHAHPSFRFHPRRVMSSLSSTTAASDTGPGPVVIGDMTLDSADHDAEGSVETPRLSGALQVTKMDSMLDEMTKFGVVTVRQNPVRIENMERQQKGLGRKKRRGVLWSRR